MVMDDLGNAMPDNAGTYDISQDVLDTWGRPETLQGHFDDHGDDFGAESPEDYVGQANDFLQQAKQSDWPTLIDKDGNIKPYDAESNTFGSYNDDHTTRTFMKPDEGPDYFSKETNQVLKDGGRLVNGTEIPEPVLMDEPFITEIPIP